MDSKNNSEFVRCGKGRKGRYALRSKRVVETLRTYFRQQKVKSKVYLFEGVRK